MSGGDLPMKTMQKTTMTPGSLAAKFFRFMSWEATSRAAMSCLSMAAIVSEGRACFVWMKKGELVTGCLSDIYASIEQ